MKANELMIGDWVLLWNKPQRVNYINLDDGERIGTDKQYLAQIVEAFEPISLTVEILEKNGFAVHRQFATFTEYWLDIPRKRVRVAPDSYIEIYNGENRNVHIDGKVYVHELQHALKLCGIDKTIEL